MVLDCSGEIAVSGRDGLLCGLLRRGRLRAALRGGLQLLLQVGQCGLGCSFGLRGVVNLLLHRRHLRCCGLSRHSRRLNGWCPFGDRPLRGSGPFGQGLGIARHATHPHGIRSLPDPDLARPVADDHRIGLVAVGDGQAEVRTGLEGLLLAPVLPPDLGSLVTAHTHDPAVTGELQCRHAAGMRGPRFHLAAVFHLPQADRAVLAARRQQVRIGPPGDARD